MLRMCNSKNYVNTWGNENYELKGKKIIEDNLLYLLNSFKPIKLYGLFC